MDYLYMYLFRYRITEEIYVIRDKPPFLLFSKSNKKDATID